MDRYQVLSLDSVTYHTINIFISGKFVSIFSFLFGLGFAVQMMRADAKGVSVLTLHGRRLTVLLVIGTLHAVLLWYGDILAFYAILGFGLLVFRKRRDKTLLVWAAILLMGVPMTLGALVLAFGPPGAPDAAEAVEAAAQNASHLAAFAAGEYAAVVSANLVLSQLLCFSPKLLFSAPHVFGLFLLGFWAGRRRIFHDVDAHRALFTRVCRWGLAIGLPAAVAQSVVLVLAPPGSGLPPPALLVVGIVGTVLSLAPLSMCYVTGLTLLFQQPRWQRRIAVLAPMGRMALSNYLSQTVMCLFIFYGYGLALIGEAGQAASFAIACAIYATQVAVSGWWLQRFRFGPMEWLWRSLTYGQTQPMRLTVAAAPLPRSVSGGEAP